MENKCENCMDIARLRADRVLQDFKIAELDKRIKELEADNAELEKNIDKLNNDIGLKDLEIFELVSEIKEIKEQKGTRLQEGEGG